jgi:hypothetical protein
VVHLGRAGGAKEGVVVDAALFAQRLEARQVADRRVQPDVEILAGRAGDFEAEVRRVARNVPGAQPAFGIQPFPQLGFHPGDGDIAIQPRAQEIGELPDFEEEMLGFAQFRGGA